MFTPGGHTTDAVEAQFSSWDSPDRWRLLVQDFPGLLLVVDTEGRILVSNYHSRELPHAPASGRSLWPAISNRFRDQIEEAVAVVQATGDIRQLEFQLSGPETAPWFSATLGPVREDGRIMAVALACSDITRYKRQEAERQASESRYRLLAESSTDIVLRSTIDGTLNYISPACQAIVGYSQAELVGQNAFDYVHPDDVGTVRALIAELHDAGDQRRLEFRVQHRTDGLRWVEATVRRVHTDRDNAPELICSVRDISRRHATLEALRESEARYRSVIEGSPMGMHFYEVNDLDDLIFVGANRAADLQLDIAHQKLIGKPILEAFPGLAETDIPQNYLRVALHGGDYHIEQSRYEDTVIKGIYEVHAFQSTPRRLSVMFLDVTDVRMAIDAIRESEEKFREIAELLPVGVYETDRDGRVTYVNNQTMAYFGLTEKDLNDGYSILDIFSAEDRIRAGRNLRRLLTGGRTSCNDYLVLRKDGTKFPARFHSTCIARDGNLCGIRGVMHDISEEKRREAEAIRSQKLASVGVLAGGIAHDFNNLLTGILGNVTLAAHDLPVGDERLQRLLDAERAVDRARVLTSQLLTFAAGGDPVKKQADLRGLLESAVLRTAQGMHIDVDLHIPEQLPPIEVDAEQMGQVMHNLLKNAGEAMPDGGTVVVSISTGEGQGGVPTVVIALEDEGCGIEADVLPHIFDPYYTTKEGRLGLGLATAYSIIAKHGGHITVDSEAGKGAAFTIEIPSLQSVDKPPRRADIPPRAVSIKKILVMDDESFICDLTTRILKRHGWKVECVADGHEAIRSYRAALGSDEPFDLVILDLTVPNGLGGKDTIAELRAIDPGVRAIVCSGYSNDPVLANYQNYGFAGIVAKPYRPDELIRVAHDVLADNTVVV